MSWQQTEFSKVQAEWRKHLQQDNFDLAADTALKWARETAGDKSLDEGKKLVNRGLAFALIAGAISFNFDLAALRNRAPTLSEGKNLILYFSAYAVAKTCLTRYLTDFLGIITYDERQESGKLDCVRELNELEEFHEYLQKTVPLSVTVEALVKGAKLASSNPDFAV